MVGGGLRWGGEEFVLLALLLHGSAEGCLYVHIVCCPVSRACSVCRCRCRRCRFRACSLSCFLCALLGLSGERRGLFADGYMARLRVVDHCHECVHCIA